MRPPHPPPPPPLPPLLPPRDDNTAPFSQIQKWLPTDGPMEGQTKPLMRGRILKCLYSVEFYISNSQGTLTPGAKLAGIASE